MISVFRLIKIPLLETNTVQQLFCYGKKSIFEIEGKLLGNGRIKRSFKSPDIYKCVEIFALKLADSG
jgi:hypothetical protein